MMEHACFDFTPFGVDKKKINTLEDFLHFIDAEFDFTSFADVLLLCARDVVTGLEFLHAKNIAHRDLKPGNTLVCNQHYSRETVDLAKSYTECPIVMTNIQRTGGLIHEIVTPYDNNVPVDFLFQVFLFLSC